MERVQDKKTKCINRVGQEIGQYYLNIIEKLINIVLAHHDEEIATIYIKIPSGEIHASEDIGYA